jgi:iron(III) transport system permease protein
VLIPVTRLDNWLAGQWQAWFGINPGLLLTGGIAALIYAYLVRFLAVALQTVEASLSKITPSMDDAARSLGSARVTPCAGCMCPSCGAACSPPACWSSST